MRSLCMLDNHMFVFVVLTKMFIYLFIYLIIYFFLPIALTSFIREYPLRLFPTIFCFHSRCVKIGENLGIC